MDLNGDATRKKSLQKIHSDLNTLSAFYGWFLHINLLRILDKSKDSLFTEATKSLFLKGQYDKINFFNFYIML